QALGPVVQKGMVEAFAGQRVQVAPGIAELVVEERADDVAWQLRAQVADLLADLVVEFGDLARSHGVAGREDHLGLAGARVRAHELVVAGLHDLAFDRLGDLFRDLGGVGARPQGVDHHHLEGELGILAAAQAEVGVRAGDRGHQHRVQDQAAMAQCPRRKVEAHAQEAPPASVAAARPSASIGRTGSPSRSRCPPAATTCSPDCSPEVTSTVVPPYPAIWTGRSSSVPSLATTNTPWPPSGPGSNAASGTDNAPSGVDGRNTRAL